MDDLQFKKQLSPLNAWAFSFGCLLGWGSFVMPATVFLPMGGVTGSLLAYLVGGAAIAAVAMNYFFLAAQCKGNGGIFYLLHNTMNRKHAFAASWAMIFANMVIIPLNARAFTRLVRALLMEYMHIEFHIRFLNTNLMLIDLFMMVGVLLLFGWINSRGVRLVGIIQTVFAIILFVGIAILFFMALFSGVPVLAKMTPSNYPGRSGLSSFLAVFIMIPWAFVGFDSVPALSREIKFSKNKLGRVMVLAVAAGAFCYMANIVITLLGVTGDFANWVDYVDNIGNMKGLNTISVVSAARSLYGKPGLLIALITLLAGILTGPNGTIAMLSRLVYGMSRSNALFPSLSKTNENGVPYRAINFALIVSLASILIASTFNTMEMIASVCTAFGYGYVSLSAFLTARKISSKKFIAFGAVGTVFCLVWVILLLIPFKEIGNSIGPSTYAYLALWVFLGIWGYAYTCRKPDMILDDDAMLKIPE